MSLKLKIPGEMDYINLKKYGFSDSFAQEAALYPGLFAARVSEQHRELYQVIGEQGELAASVSGKLAYTADGVLNFPAVGDWVMIDRMDESAGKAVIHHILQRKSVFTRKAAGAANAVQVVAANIDVVFICMSLNADFNLRRVERYLSIAWDSRAKPVVVLTKADLCHDLPRRLGEISTVSLGAEVIVCSCLEETGCQSLASYITPGRTIAFIGSSGVGKSTLINRLMGREVLATKEIRPDDDRGRHATTHRQLLLLPNGGIAIDTPGMRELQLYSGNLAKSFEDIEELAKNCKYPDCTHLKEPGCAVRRAIETGDLSEKRLANYLKLQKEIGYEGLNFRQLELEKINRMFGSKGEMKQLMRQVKKK